MLKGRAALSLWNGVDPARQAEYDLWHSREHVPERLAIPGMLRARRYHRGEGPLPGFFTLYELESSQVLGSAPYRRLLEEPSSWSRSMRPSFRGFFRVGHRIVASRGGGIGSALLAATLDALPSADRHDALASAILGETSATAIHLLEKDPSVAPVPFTVPAGGGEAVPDGAAILVECFDRAPLAGIAEMLDAALRDGGLAPPRWTRYDLAYLLDSTDLANAVPARQPGTA